MVHYSRTMKQRFSIVVFFVWCLGFLTLTTVGSALWVQTKAQLMPVSVITESHADAPYEPIQALNIHDGRIAHQRFTATATSISAIAIGTKNLRAASPDAIITVQLLDDSGNVLGETKEALHNFWPDDVTPLPLETNLTPGNGYVLQIQSEHIPKGSDASLFFSGDPNLYPDGHLTVTLEDGSQREIPGNLGFRLYSSAGPQEVWRSIAMSLAGQLALAATILWLVVGILLFILHWQFPKPVEAAARFFGPIPLALRRPDLKDALLFSGAGLVLAFTITAPYYTQTNPSSIFGDVQRALVYRAVAKDAAVTGYMGLWDPYLCGGTPLLANAESAQLDPLFLFVLAFGPNLGLRLSVTFMLAMGFAGACLLARMFMSSDRLAALFAGGIFSFSGFQMLGFSQGAFAWLPIGWIPFAILFYLLALRRWQWSLLAAPVIALLFFGGGIHMSAWAVITLTILAIVLTFAYRNARPLATLALIGAIALGFSAIKLVPALELQSETTIARPPAFVPPISWLPKMFIDRNQLKTPPWFYEPANDYFRWYDFGSYIGVIPVLLLAATLFFIRRRPLAISLWILLLVLLLMTFGYPPWTWLIRSHTLSEILRNPQRVRAVAVLAIGLLASFGATQLGNRIPNNKLRQGLLAVLVLFVLTDLVTFHRHLFTETFALPPANIPPTQSFERWSYSYNGKNSAHYKASYDTYVAGYGTTDSCLPFMLTSQAARGSDTTDHAKPYRGEAYLADGTRANFNLVSPNEFTVQLPSEITSSWLLINMNYFPGWHTDPPRQIWNQAGVLAIPITAQDTTITFKYNPLSYHLGRLLTIITLQLAIATGIMYTRALKNRKV